MNKYIALAVLDFVLAVCNAYLGVRHPVKAFRGLSFFVVMLCSAACIVNVITAVKGG